MEEKEEKTKAKETLTRDEFILMLRQFADFLEKAEEFQIMVQDTQVVVPPEGTMEVEIEVSPTKGEIEFQLSWKKAA